jgi:manganese/iron transport system ATP-binding protein
MNFLKIPKKIDLEKVSNALNKVDMSSYANSQIGELSGGQKKRVFIARALAQESRIVLLDEPFTGVDVKTEEQIMLLLKDMRSEGKIILVSTHNLGSVPEFCDRSVLINKTVLAQGATKDIYTQENLQLAFGGVLRRFVLTGKELHDDDDTREVTVLSDDERPVVIYGETENNDNKND